METTKNDVRDLNLEATELRLGLPGGIDESEKRRSNKRSLPSDANNQEFGSTNNSNRSDLEKKSDKETAPPTSKTQVVGWPPIRSNRKNCFQPKKTAETESAGNYIKVSMDGAPFLRKIDLNVYKGYTELLKAMEDMFKFSAGEYSEREGYNGSEFVPTYEDKDGDWMLVGDVPWEMFFTSCKRMRIMKGSEARGLGCCVG